MCKFFTWIRECEPWVVADDLEACVRASVIPDAGLVVRQHARVRQQGTQQPVEDDRDQNLQLYSYTASMWSLKRPQHRQTRSLLIQDGLWLAF